MPDTSLAGLHAGAPEALPIAIHERERAEVARAEKTFAGRERIGGDFEVIPIPGHTPGATAFLWDSGEHRYLFTGDTVMLRGGEWATAVLDSSDRTAYAESLELLRTLDFDVLVPWVASADGPYYAHTDAADARARLGALIARL
jgi:glyoxylase-like metal-dependent hydrolase (beta-lactamase superfamily II)